jgi:glycosyltransferase involved in cell wall biosynthesis
VRPPRRIAVLHDSTEFGGHERAFLTWAPAVLASPDVAELRVRLAESNTAFREALNAVAHPKLQVETCPYVKQAAEPYRAPLRPGYGRGAAQFVKRAGADLVLMLQGRIENLATPMLWLPKRLDMVSYLPMAHGGSEMGRSHALSVATDAVKRLYYARPQRLIVPSRAVAAQARRAGARGAIHVVENVPLPAEGERPDRRQARRALGLAQDARLALFMGRFDTHQKGLDRLLRELRRDASRLQAWRFLFVGSGPAEPDIRDVLDGAGVSGEVVGWTARPELFLAASDVLLAPSRFEGVPLVMLEALQHGLPILASDIDVYREYLPSSALRDFSQPVDLPTALDGVTAPTALQAYREHAAAVCARLDMETSRSRFVQALLGEADAARDAAR